VLRSKYDDDKTLSGAVIQQPTRVAVLDWFEELKPLVPSGARGCGKLT
jgi:hypothetical protein